MSQHCSVEFLGSVEMFSAFNPGELETLASSAELKTYEFGETVYNAGDPGDNFSLDNSGDTLILCDGSDAEREKLWGEFTGIAGALLKTD